MDEMMDASFGSSRGSNSGSKAECKDLSEEDNATTSPTKKAPKTRGLEKLQMEMIVRDSMKNA